MSTSTTSTDKAMEQIALVNRQSRLLAENARLRAEIAALENQSRAGS